MQLSVEQNVFLNILMELVNMFVSVQYFRYNRNRKILDWFLDARNYRLFSLFFFQGFPVFSGYFELINKLLHWVGFVASNIEMEL